MAEDPGVVDYRAQQSRVVQMIDNTRAEGRVTFGRDTTKAVSAIAAIKRGPPAPVASSTSVKSAKASGE